ncbi:MAG: hypothetical protein IT307_03680 [Chloroflexi bacterium]|nr:hypothetical protein [Chloroflexota bacterium]
MELVKTSIIWPGPDVDVLTVLMEPAPEWTVDPVDDRLALLRAVDSNAEETSTIVGVEIVGFLTFDRWSHLPSVPVLWQTPGTEPLPLEKLLRREQRALRSQLATPSTPR